MKYFYLIKFYLCSAILIYDVYIKHAAFHYVLWGAMALTGLAMYIICSVEELIDKIKE